VAAGEVNIRFHKWPDKLHWHFRMQRLDEDKHGVWLAAPAGVTGHRGTEPLKTFRGAFIGLVPHDRWWTAIWNAKGKYLLYVDITTPAVWDGDTVTMFDLDLDVLQHRGTGEVEVVDEDEFLHHQQRYAYPRQLIEGARAATEKVVQTLVEGDEPFGNAGPQRLADWIGA
jgi:hypothetical protein